MSIHFGGTLAIEPLTFDSIGNHWSQDDVLRPNGYPLFHYLLTEKGSGRIEIQGRSFVLSEGEGVLIAPFLRHSYSRKSLEWITSFATFTGTIENSIPKMLGLRQVIFTGRDEGVRIGSLISDIVRKYDHPPVDAKALSLDCYHLLMHFVDGVNTRDIVEEPLFKRYVEPAVKEIETNYGSELTVKALSRHVYVTPQYLSRLFGRFLGCSAYEYLTAFRINKAKELLLINSRTEVQKIAQQVGFLDTSHFIAMFKKNTGFTPLEFRRINGSVSTMFELPTENF